MVHKERKEQMIWSQSCLSHLLAVWPWEHYLTSLNCSCLIYQKKFCTRSHWGSMGKKCQRWFSVHSRHSGYCLAFPLPCVWWGGAGAVESQSGVSPGLTAAFSCTVAPHDWEVLLSAFHGHTLPQSQPFLHSAPDPWLLCDSGVAKGTTGT